ncbi:MAG: amidase [Alphaproteobacteria bacterium]|nr:amidase [Alphaproteobacteria bacterium]
MAELAFLPARGLAALVRRGRIGCLELLDYFIARIERFDAQLNAIVVRDFDRARRRARSLDRKRARDGAAGPLFGVPITTKESYNVAGLPTTWGYEERREHRAETNALIVDRLEAAGAVVFGKTNVPVSLADWQSYNPLYGVTHNPWNPAHTPGGSSGGAAAALAAGLTGFEIGSDIGGSIRVPAAFCGVYGHKPTWGLVPSRGHSLIDAAAMTDISACGPMARSADDLALGLGLLAGPDEAETALTTPLPAPRTQTIGALRIAIWADQPGQATDPEIVARIGALATFLRREGAKVSATARPDFEPTEAFHIYLALLHAAMSARASDAARAEMRAFVAKRPADDRSADAVMLRATDLLHREWLALNERRHQIRRRWGLFFKDWDVLICPAFATVALAHMQDGSTSQRRLSVGGHEIAYNELLFWPGVTCGFHLPATAAPIGFAKSGLPIGVQIVGPLYGDRMTIAVAKLLEATWQGFAPPPGFE